MDHAIKIVPESDIERASEIWRLAFGLMNYERWLFFSREILSTLVGAYCDGQLEAVAGIIDLEIQFGCRWVTLGGISAVATAPPHRRQRLVKMMLTDCLRRLHERRIPLAGLWPFSYPFYERMGWSTTNFKYEIEIEARAIKTFGDASQYRLIPAKDYRALMPLHERWVAMSNLGIKRDEVRWTNLVDDPEKVLVTFAHDDGYMIWNIKDPSDRVLKIIEWAYTTEQAFLDGLALLRNMDDLRFDKVRWVCADVEPVYQAGITYPVPTVNMRPGMMSRVVHLGSFLESLGIDRHSLRVSDPLGVTSGEYEEGGIHPGQLVQLAIGLWREPPESITDELRAVYRAAAQKPPYSAEFY